MKKFLTVFLGLILLFQMVVFIHSYSENFAGPKQLTNVKLYINDQLTDYACYENPNSLLPDSTKDFIPLRASLEAMGYDVESDETGNIIIRTEEGRNVYMRVYETTIEYCVFLNDDFSFLNEPWRSTRVPMDYIEVNGSIYYPVYEFPNVVGCYVYRDGDSIYLDSESYYNTHHRLYENIGRKVNVSAYINDKKIDSAVYYNTTSPEVEGDTLSYFVELRPIFETIGFEVEFIAPNRINIKNDGMQYATFRAKKNYENGQEIVHENGDDDCYIVNGKTYIRFSKVRYNIDGSLKQNDTHNMYLYTKDFERVDIPSDLNEAYKYFNENLSDEDIEFIKNCSDDELALTHMGLGLWVRNNWIYPSENRIAKVFTDRGVISPDNISGLIIRGYKLHLNGLPCEIDDLIDNDNLSEADVVEE